MPQQVSKSTLTGPAWRRHARGRRRAHGGEAARVLVAWSSSSDTGAGRCLAPVTLELEPSSSATASSRWRCREPSGASWVQTISAARCTEVMLTARLGDDGRARHLVLELAELLTQSLSETKPQIRVRFESSLAEPEVRGA